MPEWLSEAERDWRTIIRELHFFNGVEVPIFQEKTIRDSTDLFSEVGGSTNKVKLLLGTNVYTEADLSYEANVDEHRTLPLELLSIQLGWGLRQLLVGRSEIDNALEELLKPLLPSLQPNLEPFSVLFGYVIPSPKVLAAYNPVVTAFTSLTSDSPPRLMQYHVSMLLPVSRKTMAKELAEVVTALVAVIPSDESPELSKLRLQIHDYATKHVVPFLAYGQV